MDRENLLKELVKEKYGSVLKFSKETGIPESSIRNIFSRGMDSVNAGTLVEICKKLNVDLESLMAGSLSVRPNAQKDAAWRNYINQNSNLPDNAIPIDLPSMHRIPILGRIAAGIPIYAEENIEGYTYTDLNGGAEYFGLRVRGDSMDAAGIKDGYIVIVRRQDIVENGDIAAVLIDDQDATLKRFSRQGDTVTLMPQSTNPENHPFIYNLKETHVKILGLVVKVEFQPK